MKKNSMDKIGRIYVPKRIRSQLGFRPGERLFYSSENGRLVIQKDEADCFCCGNKKDLIPLKTGAFLCTQCLCELNEKRKQS